MPQDLDGVSGEERGGKEEEGRRNLWRPEVRLDGLEAGLDFRAPKVGQPCGQALSRQF